MTRHILIDLNELKILKAVEGEDALKRCEYWADILIPKGEFYICGYEKRDLATFTMDELKLLYTNEFDRIIRWSSLSEGVEKVGEIMELMKPDDTDLGALVRKLGRPLREPDFTPIPDTTKEPRSSLSGIPTRPKAGTMTARAWEAADYFYDEDVTEQLNSPEFKKKVVEACVDSGVNPSTAATQFGKWKKYKLASN